MSMITPSFTPLPPVTIQRMLRHALHASAISLGLLSGAMAQTAPTLQAPSATPAPPIVLRPLPDTFFSGQLQPRSWLATDAISEPVQNLQKEKIGEVNDLVIDGDGKVVAAVIGIGGFLGMGEKDVAVTIQALRMNQNDKGKTVLTLDVSKEALKSAPAYNPITTATRN